MTILEKYEEKLYNGTEEDMKKRHLYLAYLMLAMENPCLHPDDYTALDSGYCGWHVLLVNQVWRNGSELPDNFRYPTAFLRAKKTLEMFEGFHNDDDEPDYLAIIGDVKFFLEEMKPTELEGIVDGLQKLYLFHATEDEDIEYVADLRDMADVLNWVMHF